MLPDIFSPHRYIFCTQTHFVSKECSGAASIKNSGKRQKNLFQKNRIATTNPMVRRMVIQGEKKCGTYVPTAMKKKSKREQFYCYTQPSPRYNILVLFSLKIVFTLVVSHIFFYVSFSLVSCLSLCRENSSFFQWERFLLHCIYTYLGKREKKSEK